MSKDPFQDIDTNEDPFNDIDTNNNAIDSTKPDYQVHIRIQQRTGRKSITIVEHLPPKLNTEKVLKHLKKNLNCNGQIFKESKEDIVINLTGDQRVAVRDFLIKSGICTQEQVIIHGAL